MQPGHTKDGYALRSGEQVWIAFHVEIEQPKCDPPLPRRFVWTPQKLILKADKETWPEESWRSYRECHTYCESLNRAL